MLSTETLPINTELSIRAYKEAAEHDAFLFGDYDYSYVWNEDIENNE